MIPIMLSEAAPPALIGGILLVKVITGIVCGLVLDFVLTKTGRLHTGLSSLKRHQGHGDNDIHELCEEEGCECSDEDPELLQPGRTDPADSSLQPGRTDPVAALARDSGSVLVGHRVACNLHRSHPTSLINRGRFSLVVPWLRTTALRIGYRIKT